jgi:hypothetical protein
VEKPGVRREQDRLMPQGAKRFESFLPGLDGEKADTLVLDCLLRMKE